MEVFMSNISFSLTKHQVSVGITNILHSQEYSHFSPLPLNFYVYLFKDKNGLRKHNGRGTLTLPSPDIALKFLQEYGDGDAHNSPARSLILGQRRIKFVRGRRPPRSDVLESIIRLPYIDPKVSEEKERRTALMDSKAVSIKTIQFGWECRDNVFSIEWEGDFEGSSSLSFDSERREIRIKIMDSITNPLTIAIRYSHINYLSVHRYLSEQPIIYFSLAIPPAFEQDSWGQKLRQRLSALPIKDHARVAPYASLALRLICSSYADLGLFRNLCHAAHLHDIHDTELPVDYRHLFSSEALGELHLWLRKLNWCISFQIEALVRSLVVDVQEMLSLIPDIRRIISVKGKKYVVSLLRHFGACVKALFWDLDGTQAEETVMQCFARAEREYEKQLKSLQPTDSSLFEALHVTVTPTTMFLEGPFPERSNRVIRSYDPIHHESFLRVSFVDEARLQYRFDRDIDGPGFIQNRVGSMLLGGLTIAHRTFKFLAYSQSALKEHAVWFVKSFRDSQRGYVDAPTIIRSLGSFDNLEFDPKLIYCPARYAARISLAFTATDASVSVEEVEEIFHLRDISTESGKYTFTDGVGTMSLELAHDIWTKLKATRRRARRTKGLPRAFQIRFMGSKGMLSVDHKLQGRAICLRPSMIKFEAPESREVEIARVFDRPGQYFLNRPLIMLLEGLGVPYETFKAYQDKAVLETHRSKESLVQTARMLECYGLGTSYRLTSVLINLDKLGIDTMPGNAFYDRMLDCSVNHVLRLLKNHARIPIADAWTLVGVADIHKFLQPDEIFAYVKPSNGMPAVYLEGPIVISRSPTIHPGDVQVVHAIGRPPAGSCFAKEPLPNTVVFSVLGERPLPSYLGGGDLDGDVYNLIPLNKAPGFKPKTAYPPGEYKPAEKKTLDRPSTMNDVAEFVMQYINSDVLGIIAINWLIIADQSSKGIFDEDCIKLAHLHSDAVDYPKTGQPVALTAIPKLKFPLKPDWNAPETVNLDSGNYYKSTRAVGRLFREIDLPIVSVAKEKYRDQHRIPRESQQRNIDDLNNALLNIELFDTDPLSTALEHRISQFISVDEAQSPDEIDYIVQIFSRYASELRTICATNTLSHARSPLLTEEEAMIGTIVQKCSQARKRTDMMSKLREQTDILVRGVREEMEGDDIVTRELVLQRAWSAWQLSCTAHKSFGAQSFGWIALGVAFEAIKDMEEELEGSQRFY